ncbi:endonuclease/exonuclease/phosphatase family protein [Paenibacillus macerans]|uniref:endonuclease/exonuclease/phosphatase family protein n=1 Tax=Paenibacillus macerans TaxID=44252 RepID=UPI00203AC084|nr:endonuclease/exonuclease/phosphatase family protein [Paenibacillus macerans]MCM3700424.1 endonuclease/exonuclease/phosphatase family protein [Paenibacillus macerans]
MRGKERSTELELRCMSYNIKNDYDLEGENIWSGRRDMVAGIIRFHRPDLVGMQEVLHRQLEDLQERLPEYGWVGSGRDDGEKEGEFCCIFYLKKRLEPLKHGRFWLSEEPEKPGVPGWDAACPRIVTWCVFRDIDTGEVITHLNTHFDHIGKVAVEQSAHLIKNRIREISGEGATVLTGDFNVTRASGAYGILTRQEGGEAVPLLYDASLTADYKHFGPEFTFQGFDIAEVAARQFPSCVSSREGHGIEFDSAIDFIFVTRGVRVRNYGVIADHRQGKLPSDHFPVVADVLVAAGPAVRG